MSPVRGAPVNAQPDKHNSKDQEDHLQKNIDLICDLDDKSLMTKRMMMVKKAMMVMMITKQMDFWTTKALLF